MQLNMNSRGFFETALGAFFLLFLVAIFAGSSLLGFSRDNSPRPELCEKVSGSALKDGCYLEVALSSNNEVFCEKISSNSTKDTCFSQLAAGHGAQWID